MHVVYIHQHFATPQGSTGTRSYEMSRCLLHAGHRVTMICGAYESSDLGSPTRQRVAEQEVDGIRVLRIAEPYANKMGFARRLLAFGRFARTATQVARRLDADLVFATSTPLTVGIPGMKAAKTLGVPFVFEVRDLWPQMPIEMGILKNPALVWYARRLERNIYRAAQRIVALSPGIKEGICSTGYPAERVAMVPNSADLDLFRPDNGELTDERFGPAGDFKLVFTGAHGVANGLDAVLDAIVELKRRGEAGLRFVFIGRGGLKERLMQRSRREGIASMVSWLSPMPKQELATVLPRMNAGLMVLANQPVFYYGTSPNKFFDYISSGLPVLNNYPGWLAELITENRCGRVVPPDDPAAFADAVVWLRDHPEEVAALGRQSRQLAESQFSRERLGQAFVETLEQCRRTF